MYIKEAVRRWINEMNAIPQSMLQRLVNEENDNITEITPPVIGDRVYLYHLSDSSSHYGEISECADDVYAIRTDDDKDVIAARNDFMVERDSPLPLWGTMWTFRNPLDKVWLKDEKNLQNMADCGFRIYDTEWGIFFGIDGGGYDFYDAHWVPLYKARGLQGHVEENAA